MTIFESQTYYLIMSITGFVIIAANAAIFFSIYKELKKNGKS